MAAECEASYGFLPCSVNGAGSAFLVLVYGYIILQGANTLSGGSELLLEILDPGLIGGLLLPILGALPDACIIIAAVAGGSTDAAALSKEVAVGLGTLAGSSVLLLTATWAGSLFLGRCDLNSRGRAINKRLTRHKDLLRTGVTTDSFTPLNAWIMLGSVALFLVVQIPSVISQDWVSIAELVGGILCMVSLAAYCAYQVVYPELQRRKMEAAHKRLQRLRALHKIETVHGVLLKGDVDPVVLSKLFEICDRDHNGTVDKEELMAFLLGLTQSERPLQEFVQDNVKKEDMKFWLKEFDSDNDGLVSRDEFNAQLVSWVRDISKAPMKEGEESFVENGPPSGPTSNSGDVEEALADEEENEDDDDESEEGGVRLTMTQIIIKAVAMLAGGTLICAAFSDPLVGAVSNLAAAINVDPFFVAFVLNPLASNASEIISSLNFASGKTVKRASLTFSQVYGAVTMNNTMNLGLFLIIMYAKSITWVYSSEVLAVGLATLFVGVLGATRETIPTYWALPVLAIYPLSLLLVWVLDTYAGWQ